MDRPNNPIVDDRSVSGPIGFRVSWLALGRPVAEVRPPADSQRPQTRCPPMSYSAGSRWTCNQSRSACLAAGDSWPNHRRNRHEVPLAVSKVRDTGAL